MAQGNPPHLALVDISPFLTEENLVARRHVADELRAACHANGCVAIKGHGVNPDLLRDVFSRTKDFFALPYDTKMQASRPNDPDHHRGFSGLGREQPGKKTALETGKAMEAEKITSFHESFQLGNENNTSEKNIWLPEEIIPGLRQATDKLYHELYRAAKSTLEALIMSLNLSPEEAEQIHALHPDTYSVVKLLHYPPISAEVDRDRIVSRIAAHKDYSSFTLLFHDSTPGLEFEDSKTGRFMSADVEDDDGVLYMNIGDIFSRISNGYYPAPLHRVTLPHNSSDENHGSLDIPSRYSIPFFVVPDVQGIIAPQPSLIAAHGTANYEPMNFGEYLRHMHSLTQVGDKA